MLFYASGLLQYSHLRRVPEYYYGTLYLFDGAVPSGIKELRGKTTRDLRNECVMSMAVEPSFKHLNDTYADAFKLRTNGVQHTFLANNEVVDRRRGLLPPKEVFFTRANAYYGKRYLHEVGDHAGTRPWEDVLLAQNPTSDSERWFYGSYYPYIGLNEYWSVIFDLGKEDIDWKAVHLSLASSGSYQIEFSQDNNVVAYEQHDETFDMSQVKQGEHVRIRDSKNLPQDLIDEIEAKGDAAWYNYPYDDQLWQLYNENGAAGARWRGCSADQSFDWAEFSGLTSINNFTDDAVLSRNSASYVSRKKPARYFRLRAYSHLNANAYSPAFNWIHLEPENKSDIPQTSESRDVTWAVFVPSFSRAFSNTTHYWNELATSKFGDTPMVLMDVGNIDETTGKEGIVLNFNKDITEENHREVAIVDNKFIIGWSET